MSWPPAVSRSARCSTPTTPGAQFEPSGGSGRVGGPAGRPASYGSFATFSDPDGNSCLLQEVTTRLPGRIDAAETSYASVNDLEQRVRRAAAAHGEHEKHHRGVRRELAGLVRRLHGGRAVRRRAPRLSQDAAGVNGRTARTRSTTTPNTHQINPRTQGAHHVHHHCTRTPPPHRSSSSPALTDFGPGRSELFGNSADDYLQVHDRGSNTSPTSPRVRSGIWERLHYDWSDPSHVVLTTTDSNVWGGSSGHTYTFTPLADGTTDVDVVVVREGKNLKGRVLGFGLGIVGKRFLGKALQTDRPGHRSAQLLDEPRGSGLTSRH